MSKDDPRQHNMAVDTDGNPLPFAPIEVRKMVLKMIDEGDIIAVIVRTKEGLGVQVVGPPSRELLDILEQTTRAYRRVLKGH